MATKNSSSTKKAAQPKAKGPGMATAAYLAATAKADHRNARLREERGKSKDGQTASRRSAVADERAIAESKTPAAKVSAKPKAPTRQAKPNGKLSAVDAALKVLADAKKPMSCGQLIESMTARKLWSSPNGKTPAATLYSAILRDLQNGKDARFRKVERGLFTLAKKGA